MATEPADKIASMTQQREQYRADWHERHLPEGAVLVDSRDNSFVYEYTHGKSTYRVSITVKLIK